MILADILDHWPATLAGQLFWLIVCMLTVGILVLTFWKLAQERWGKKPNGSVESHNATVAKLQAELARLPDEETKMKKLTESLGEFFTNVQAAALDLKFRAELMELREYAHRSRHELTNILGAKIGQLELEATKRGERLELVEKLERADGEKLDRIETMLARLEERVDPYWKSLQAIAATALHKPEEASKMLDGLLEKLKAVDLDESERELLTSILTAMRSGSHKEDAKKAGILLDVMPWAKLEQEGKLPPTDMRSMEEKEASEEEAKPKVTNVEV